MRPMVRSTSQDELTARLHELYADRSKHSVYQNIPEFVRNALSYTETIDERWRGDGSRWEYIREHLDVGTQSILDVGANTGFFTLSLAHAHRNARCTALEGNPRHAEFISLVASQFHLTNVHVLSQYLDRGSISGLGRFDLLLLFNVLHHAGIDFDQALVPTRSDLAVYLIDYLGALREHTKQLVFQMGFNWGGNKQQPIVDLQDDAGKVLYGTQVLQAAGWRVDAIATPYMREGDVPVMHRNLPEEAVAKASAGDEAKLRQMLATVLDPATASFSEFYRRPLFVCSAGPQENRVPET